MGIVQVEPVGAFASSLAVYRYIRPQRHAHIGAAGEDAAVSSPDRRKRSQEASTEGSPSALHREGVTGRGRNALRLHELNAFSQIGAGHNERVESSGIGTGHPGPNHRLPLGISTAFTAQLLAQENAVAAPASEQARRAANLAAYDAAMARGRQFFGPQMPFTLRV